jgi:hypothetical protein
MTAPLITLTQAKDQLVYEADDRDSEILLKIEEASSIVTDYLKRPDHGWTDRTVPGHVRAAVRLVLANLWAQRGDVDGADPLSPAVKSLLHRERDPTLA